MESRPLAIAIMDWKNQPHVILFQEGDLVTSKITDHKTINRAGVATITVTPRGGTQDNSTSTQLYVLYSKAQEISNEIVDFILRGDSDSTEIDGVDPHAENKTSAY